jgi:hypothetical protein
MFNSSSRSAPRAGHVLFVALFVVFVGCFQLAYAGLDEGTFDLSSLQVTGVSSKGNRLAPKPITKIKRIKD